MAWETVVLKVPGAKKPNKIHQRHWLCPKCDGKPYTISYHSDTLKGITSNKSLEDEMEYLVLICDCCGDYIAFDGCTGECSRTHKTNCEICGKYYCKRCGMSADIDVDEKHIELRYCCDHIPEWYKNR